MDAVRIAVVGAGVIGLSTALCISQLVPRCSVTVLSDRFTPDTTSNVAAGMLIPHTYPDTPVPTQKRWFRETFQHLSEIAKSAEAADAGAHLVSGWQIFRSVPAEEAPFWADVVLGFRKMSEAELKRFPQHVFGQAFTTLKCETSAYLPWLEKRLVEMSLCSALFDMVASYRTAAESTQQTLWDFPVWPCRSGQPGVSGSLCRVFARQGRGPQPTHGNPVPHSSPFPQSKASH